VQEETDQLQLVDGMAWVNFFFKVCILYSMLDVRYFYWFHEGNCSATAKQQLINTAWYNILQSCACAPNILKIQDVQMLKTI